MLPKFAIIPTDLDGSYAVYINNEKIHGVTAVHIDLAANEMPKVQLEFTAGIVAATVLSTDIKGIFNEDDRTD